MDQDYEYTLIQQIQSGDINAFRHFVEKYKQDIYYLALDLTGHHHDAEDLSQEVFIKVYSSIHSFRRDAALSSWLYRITVNAFIDKKRKKAWQILRFKLDSYDEADSPVPEPKEFGISGDPERRMEGILFQEHLKKALKKLSPKEKTVFILRHYHDKSIKEIAEMLEIASGTVKSLIFRTVKKLQKELAFYKEES
jgi:RNA polymerase sigma-70 factor (ECF subfamily)